VSKALIPEVRAFYDAETESAVNLPCPPGSIRPRSTCEHFADSQRTVCPRRISFVQKVKCPKLRPTWLRLSLTCNQSFRQSVSAEHNPRYLDQGLSKSRRPACAYPLPRPAPTSSGRNNDDLHICLTTRVSMGRRVEKNKGIIGLVADESPRGYLTKLCRSCGRLLDDHARFCDRCGSVQPLQPAPQVQYQYPQPSQPAPESQYQYLQPPPPSLARAEPVQRQPAPAAPAKHAPRIVLQEPPRPETVAAITPSRPAVKVGRWTLRRLGRKPNYLGILGAIVAFASLVMPWWNMTASVPIVGLGNSTAIDFPLYLYSTSASLLANPPSQVISLNLWFCWVTLALVGLAGILAMAGSMIIGKGNRILLIGGVIGLLSIVVFAIGLQSELSTAGSGLDLFKTASGTWGTLATYLSFGFWGALVAAVTMLVAAMRGGAIATAPPRTVQPYAPEVAPIGTRVAEATQEFGPAVQASPTVRAGRPRGVKLLIGYCIVLGICAVASIPFVSSLVDGIPQLFLSAWGIGLSDPTYLWGLLGFSAVMDFVIAFGLLKRLKLVRTITRVLSVAAVACALIVICLVAVLLVSPNLLGVQTGTPLPDSSVAILYGALAEAALLGVVLPLIIFRYLGRPSVKEYFGIVE
jgi:hypothetical protein